MSVRVTDNHSRIRLQKHQQASLFLRYFADAVQRSAYPKTPKKYGMLRRSVVIQVLGLHGLMRWVKDYAIFQESGMGNGPIRNYTTPGTGPHFARNAVLKEVINTSAIAKKARLI